MDGVLVTRQLFLGLLLSALLILLVLLFTIERVGEPDAALGVLVVVLGVAGIAAAARTANRRLDATSPSTLAQSYRINFVLGFALNQAPLLVSIVLCFTRGELWPYLLAFPCISLGWRSSLQVAETSRAVGSKSSGKDRLCRLGTP